MATFRERRQLARDTGERIAAECIDFVADETEFTALAQRMCDYILTETDGSPEMHSARLHAYHAIIARFAPIIETR